MSHSFEECPLHELGLGELENVARMLGIEIPSINSFNKKEVIKMLHEYVEKNGLGNLID